MRTLLVSLLMFGLVGCGNATEEVLEEESTDYVEESGELLNANVIEEELSYI